jgi:hypothetical protein
MVAIERVRPVVEWRGLGGVHPETTVAEPVLKGWFWPGNGDEETCVCARCIGGQMAIHAGMSTRYGPMRRSLRAPRFCVFIPALSPGAGMRRPLRQRVVPITDIFGLVGWRGSPLVCYGVPGWEGAVGSGLDRAGHVGA